MFGSRVPKHPSSAKTASDDPTIMYHIYPVKIRFDRVFTCIYFCTAFLEWSKKMRERYSLLHVGTTEITTSLFLSIRQGAIFWSFDEREARFSSRPRHIRGVKDDGRSRTRITYVNSTVSISDRGDTKMVTTTIATTTAFFAYSKIERRFWWLWSYSLSKGSRKERKDGGIGKVVALSEEAFRIGNARRMRHHGREKVWRRHPSIFAALQCRCGRIRRKDLNEEGTVMVCITPKPRRS